MVKTLVILIFVVEVGQRKPQKFAPHENFPLYGILVPNFHCTILFLHNARYQRMMSANVGDAVSVHESVVRGHHTYKQTWTL